MAVTPLLSNSSQETVTVTVHSPAVDFMYVTRTKTVSALPSNLAKAGAYCHNISITATPPAMSNWPTQFLNNTPSITADPIMTADSHAETVTEHVTTTICSTSRPKRSVSMGSGYGWHHNSSGAPYSRHNSSVSLGTTTTTREGLGDTAQPQRNRPGDAAQPHHTRPTPSDITTASLNRNGTIVLLPSITDRFTTFLPASRETPRRRTETSETYPSRVMNSPSSSEDSPQVTGFMTAATMDGAPPSDTIAVDSSCVPYESAVAHPSGRPGNTLEVSQVHYCHTPYRTISSTTSSPEHAMTPTESPSPEASHRTPTTFHTSTRDPIDCLNGLCQFV